MKGIAAMASNGVIGKEGKLPWRIPGDLKFFKKMTDGGTLIMGRKTYDGLPPKFDLGTRKLIVLSNKALGDKEYGKITYKNYPCALPDDAWICGGGEVYRQLLPRCTDFYLTLIAKPYEGDARLPDFSHLFRQWDVIEKNDEYSIIHYKAINFTKL